MFLRRNLEAHKHFKAELNKRRRLYPKLYDYSFIWCRHHRNTLQTLCNLLKQRNEPQTILDIGCGNKPLQKIFNNVNYLGVDIQPSEFVDFTIDCNHTKLPVSDQSIDAVIMSNSLEHIFNTQFVLSEVKRVLRPGGFFYFSVPMTYPIHAYPDDYLRFTPNFFEREFADWKAIKLQISNSIFTTPFLLAGQIISIFSPNWLITLPIVLNNVLILSLDLLSQKAILWSTKQTILKKIWESSPIEINGLYQLHSHLQNKNNGRYTL